LKIKYSVLGLLLSMPLLAADADLPAFADFPVNTGEQRLQSIDFDSHPEARNFRTRLEYNLNETANFAGHYILTSWGCGTMCQMIALIDVNNGEVFMPPELVSSLGFCYRRDSSMLILNPVQDLEEMFGDQVPAWFNMLYYQWDGEQVQQLLETREPVIEDCDFF